MKIIRQKKFNGVRALMLIQLVLVLLLPFLFTQTGGCQGQDDTLPLNLGAEVSPRQLDAAISKPLEKSDPVSIKLGEAFVVSETQELGAGAAFAIVSDTAQSVIERIENTAEIFLTVIETKQKYINGDVQKSSTEIPYRIEKAAKPASPVTTNATPNATDNVGAANFRPEVESMLRNVAPMSFLNAIREREARQNDQKNAPQNAINAKNGVDIFAEKVTYHGLKVVVSQDNPPPAVQQARSCLGIPNCKITVHHIDFDMVFWHGDKPERVHWELALSPDAPYLAAMMNKCVSGLAKLADNQGDILVRQCLPVINFRYVQPQL